MKVFSTKKYNFAGRFSQHLWNFEEKTFFAFITLTPSPSLCNLSPKDPYFKGGQWLLYMIFKPNKCLPTPSPPHPNRAPPHTHRVSFQWGGVYSRTFDGSKWTILVPCHLQNNLISCTPYLLKLKAERRDHGIVQWASNDPMRAIRRYLDHHSGWCATHALAQCL